MSRTIRKDPYTFNGWKPECPWKQHSRSCGFHTSRANTEAPSWWNHMFTIVPRRRRDKFLCKAVLDGRLDPDDIGWGVVDPLPHMYFW